MKKVCEFLDSEFVKSCHEHVTTNRVNIASRKFIKNENLGPWIFTLKKVCLIDDTMHFKINEK